jgi:hypothetical protein
MIPHQENSPIERGSLGGVENEAAPMTCRTPNLDDTDGNQIVRKPSFVSIDPSSSAGCLVRRLPGQLRLHPTLVRLKLVGAAIELNQDVRLPGRSVREQILVTETGTIISGFKAWHEAIRDGRQQVDCIEYSLNEEQALEYILN